MTTGAPSTRPAAAAGPGVGGIPHARHPFPE